VTVEMRISNEELAKRSPLYLGYRQSDCDPTWGRPEVWYIAGPGDYRRVSHVMLHSPDGFEWGYGGSGPADLALSILAHHLRSLLARLYGDANAAPASSCNEAFAAVRELHQAFKWEFVARFDHDLWMLPVERINDWLRRQTENLLVTAETRRFLTVLLVGAGELTIELDGQEESGPEEAAR